MGSDNHGNWCAVIRLGAGSTTPDKNEIDASAAL
jgi:hypothetical protein